MPVLPLLLIALGPWLVVGTLGFIAASSWPGMLAEIWAAIFRPASRPRPRPVTRPRPARWAVAA